MIRILSEVIRFIYNLDGVILFILAGSSIGFCIMVLVSLFASTHP